MTTTITIKHEGPDHHDVLITRITPAAPTYHRLRPGESHTEAMWDSKKFEISEVPKLIPDDKKEPE